MVLDVAILVVGARSPGRKYERLSVFIVAESRLLAAKAFVVCQDGERPAAERALATTTTDVARPLGPRLAMA